MTDVHPTTKQSKFALSIFALGFHLFLLATVITLVLALFHSVESQSIH